MWVLKFLVATFATKMFPVSGNKVRIWSQAQTFSNHPLAKKNSQLSPRCVAVQNSGSISSLTESSRSSRRALARYWWHAWRKKMKKASVVIFSYKPWLTSFYICLHMFTYVYHSFYLVNHPFREMVGKRPPPWPPCHESFPSAPLAFGLELHLFRFEPQTNT